jgi:hypothetical protein
MRRANIFATRFASPRRHSADAGSPNPRSVAMRSWQASSFADPDATKRNWISSRLLRRPQPSAMLDATDTAARRIWDVIPKRSTGGNDSVWRYVATANRCAYSATTRFSVSCMLQRTTGLEAHTIIRIRRTSARAVQFTTSPTTSPLHHFTTSPRRRLVLQPDWAHLGRSSHPPRWTNEPGGGGARTGYNDSFLNLGKQVGTHWGWAGSVFYNEHNMKAQGGDDWWQVAG